MAVLVGHGDQARRHELERLIRRVAREHEHQADVAGAVQLGHLVQALEQPHVLQHTAHPVLARRPVLARADDLDRVAMPALEPPQRLQAQPERIARRGRPPVEDHAHGPVAVGGGGVETVDVDGGGERHGRTAARTVGIGQGRPVDHGRDAQPGHLLQHRGRRARGIEVGLPVLDEHELGARVAHPDQQPRALPGRGHGRVRGPERVIGALDRRVLERGKGLGDAPPDAFEHQRVPAVEDREGVAHAVSPRQVVGQPQDREHPAAPDQIEAGHEPPHRPDLARAGRQLRLDGARVCLDVLCLDGEVGRHHQPVGSQQVVVVGQVAATAAGAEERVPRFGGPLPQQAADIAAALGHARSSRGRRRRHVVSRSVSAGW